MGGGGGVNSKYLDFSKSLKVVKICDWSHRYFFDQNCNYKAFLAFSKFYGSFRNLKVSGEISPFRFFPHFLTLNAKRLIQVKIGQNQPNFRPAYN